MTYNFDLKNYSKERLPLKQSNGRYQLCITNKLTKLSHSPPTFTSTEKMPAPAFPVQDIGLGAGARTRAYTYCNKYTHYLRDNHAISGIYFCLLTKNRRWGIKPVPTRSRRGRRLRRSRENCPLYASSVYTQKLPETTFRVHIFWESALSG